jgi:hypothetical protein
MLDWKSLFSSTATQPKKSARRSSEQRKFRPQLQSLENRDAPCSVHVPAFVAPLVSQCSHAVNNPHCVFTVKCNHGHPGQGGGGTGGTGGGTGSTTESISGTVVNGRDNTTPEAGVTVTLTNTTTGAVQSVTTDANGNFSFSGLQAGTYTLVETPGQDFQAVTSPGAGTPAGTPGTGQITGIVITNANGTGYVLAETPPIIA